MTFLSLSLSLSLSPGGRGKRPYDYYPAECLFPSVASIPERLFWDVLNCYKNYKEYCKWCYYEKDERVSEMLNFSICFLDVCKL